MGRPDPAQPKGHGHGHEAKRDASGHGEAGPPPKRIIVGYGFWIFLLSATSSCSPAFFAAYAVLGGPDGGRTERQTAVRPDQCRHRNRPAFWLSSFSCGLAASLAAAARYKVEVLQLAMAVTFLFGAALHLPGAGAARVHRHGRPGAQGRSAAPSSQSFFALVGCHGLHVTAGLLWLLTMMAQVFAKGFRLDILRRIMCFSLFWHALDIIWVAVFTVVYLLGAAT